MTKSHSFEGSALFDADRVRAILSAFDAACRALPKQPPTDAERAALARAITEAAEMGEADPIRLCDIAVERVRAKVGAKGERTEGSV